MRAPEYSEMDDRYQRVVRKDSWIDRIMRGLLAHPRKYQWASYFRSLKRIPKTSPVYGCRSWKRINERRHEVIEKTIRQKKPRDPEFKALQGVDCQFACSVVSNFILSRTLLRIKAGTYFKPPTP